MRGKNYSDGSRRLVGGGSLGVILIVLTLAIALIFVLLIYLPLTDPTNTAGVLGKGVEQEWNNIVSISYSQNEIGVGSQKEKIFLTVTYDNGTKEDVSMGQMICSGLDVTTSGTQNVSLSYGGFEQTIPITVKDVDCTLTYTASDGGRIQGEAKQSIVSGNDASTVQAIPETGYTFVEWNDGYPYATRKDKNVNESREYKAVFEKTRFVVFFYYDDGTVARESTVMYGESVTDIPKLSDPRMNVYGKTFQGWSINEDDYKCVLRDLDIYPQYIKTATDVNVTVNRNQYGNHMGKTNANELGYYAHNEIASIIATPYSAHEFDCWQIYGYATPDSSTPEWLSVKKRTDVPVSIFIGDNKEECIFSSTSVGNTGTEYALTFTPNEMMDVIDIKAEFVSVKSKVNFINYQSSIKNNEEYSVSDIAYTEQIMEYELLRDKPEDWEKKYGDYFIKSGNDYERNTNPTWGSGYYRETGFILYSYTPTLGEVLARRYREEGGTEYTPGSSVRVEHGALIVLTDSPYTETVIANDGSLLEIEKPGIATLVPQDVYGYTFLGWYDKLDDRQELVTNNKVFREDTSLIAKWEKKTYTVVFDYSTADNCDVDYSIVVSYESTIGSGGGIPAEAPSLNKHVFIGWEDNLTHELIGDTTLINVKEEYLTDSAKNFLDNRTIYMIPRWAVKEHKLVVSATGSGTVMLGIDPPVGMGSYQETIITGEQTIYETYNYRLILRADTGFYVSSYSCVFTASTGETEQSLVTDIFTNSMTPIPKSNGSSVYRVVFSPIKYTVTVNNGDSLYRGYIEGIAGSDTETVTYKINYGETISLNVVSPNEAFEISEIRVSGKVAGKVLDEELIEKGMAGSHSTFFNLILETCTSDLTITIKYNAVTYTVSTAQPRNGEIGLTVFNGDESDYSIAPSQTVLPPDERAFYVLSADEEHYISDVRINGIRYDVFSSPDPSVVFYDWEINNVYYGVGLKKINDVYYYTYGTARYDGADYLYCRTVIGNEEQIFIVLDALNERYEPIDGDGAANAAVDPAYYESLSDSVRRSLSVDEKGIGDSSVEKDNRVTAVKLMLLPTANLNLSIQTSELYFAVSVADNKSATGITVSSTQPKLNDRLTVSIRSLLGYEIVGYYLNGSEEMVDLRLSTPRTSYSGTFTVTSDMRFEFVINVIHFSATFSSVNTNNVVTVKSEAEETGNPLASSYTYSDIVYGAKASYFISVKEGYRISVLTVDDGTGAIVYPVTYNMTSYAFTSNSVLGNLFVRIECSSLIANDVPADAYTLTVSSGENASGSVEYDPIHSTVKLVVMAKEGYTINGLTVQGSTGDGEKIISVAVSSGSISLNDQTNRITNSDFSYLSNAPEEYSKAFVLTLPEDLFVTGSTASAIVTATAKSYVVRPLSCEHGSINGGNIKSAQYGTVENIDISADENYYLETFMVNGIPVPFTSEDWRSFENISVTSDQYKAAVYRLTVYGDAELSAVFKKCTYSVKLEGESFNGSTSIIVISEGNSSALTNGRAPYGSYIRLSMKASDGYHIKSVYVNGIDAGYAIQEDTNENNNTTDIFTYTGENEEGLTRNVSIRVFYEINRYSFNYTIKNVSQNFFGVAGAGALTSVYTLQQYDAVQGTGTYTGIAYGDNFYVNVIPSVSSGYYLYSMSITYKGTAAVATTRTRYCTDPDGIVSKSGGSIWFNRFWFGNLEATGVTSDITDITVTFMREDYTLSLYQRSIGGRLNVSFTNPTAGNNAGVYVRGRKVGTDVDIAFRYMPETGVFQTVDVWIDSEGRRQMNIIDSNTGISLRYASGTYGEVVFGDGTYTYEMYVEFGVRCNVDITPNEGYDRTLFIVNDEDKLDSIGGNLYTFNIYRASSVEVSYSVQRFDIGINSIIYTDMQNNKTVTANNSSDYINIVITIVDDRGNPLGTTYTKEPYSLSLTKELPYGTYLRIDIESKFSTKGVYLYRLTQTVTGSDGNKITSDVQLVNGDVQGLIRFCDSSDPTNPNKPFKVTGELMLRAIFDVRSYEVTTGITYDESLPAESKNNVTNASDSTKTEWSVFWGNNSEAEVYIDRGYEWTEIIVSTESQTISLTPHNMGMEPSSISDEFTAYYKESVLDPVYGTRNILYLYMVKSNVSIEVRLSRRSYRMVYSLNDTQTVASLYTYYNEFNNVYPKQNNNAAGIWQIDTRYYDELHAVITPIDGYEIVAAQVSVYSIEWSEEISGWKKVSQDALIMLSMDVYNDDAKEFLFHKAQESAQLVVTGDLLVELSVTIKRYRLETTIIRTNAAGDLSQDKNNTIVSLDIRVSQSQSEFLIVNGSAQTTQELKKEVRDNQSTVQHGSIVTYEFITPEGYMLDTFTANGLTLTDMKEYVVVTSSKYADDNSRYYYKIVITVCTELVKGARDFFKSTDKLVVVNMSIMPITYNIYIVVNNGEVSQEGSRIREYRSIDDRNGATDDQTIVVYSPKTAVHFSTIVVEPSLLEGYQIDSTNAYIGVQNSISGLTDLGDNKANFSNITQLTNKRNLKIEYSTIKAADVTLGKTSIYFYFYTSIIYYDLKYTSTVFYSNEGTLMTTSLKNYNAGASSNAGRVEGNVYTTITNAGGGSVDGELNGSFPYFSNVTIKAVEQNASFNIFAIYEKINGTWTTVSDNVNGISLTTGVENGINYQRITYMVDGRGNREFKIDYKQKTKITVNIPNPYKYEGLSSNPYLYYTSIYAYESDVETETGRVIQPESVSSTAGIVRTQYVYNVFVGNYFSIYFNDTYRKNTVVNFSVYDVDLGEIAEQAIENPSSYVSGTFNLNSYKNVYNSMVNDTVHPHLISSAVYGGDKSGKRYHIVGGETFYVYDNDNYAHVAGSKVTSDATNAVNKSSNGSSQLRETVGGAIYYNATTSETVGNVIYEDTLYESTKTGNYLTIICKANPNYVFYSLQFRQMDREASKNAGNIVFGTGDTNSWLTIDYTMASNGMTSNITAFNATNSNGYKLLNFRKEGEEYRFTIWMNGDMEIRANYYRTYNVSYAVYLPDVLLAGGELSASGINVVIDANSRPKVKDTVFGNPFAGSTGENVVVSYGAEFSLKVDNQSSNYAFVGWYLNDINLFDSLDKQVPDSNYYTWNFIVDKDNMSSLIVNGEEVVDIVIYARFEPIIDVQMINEKYYAYDYHFNSWNMGTVQMQFYGYNKKQEDVTGVPGSSSTRMLPDDPNESKRSISEAITYIGETSAGTYGTAWSELCSDSVVSAYSQSLKNTYYVFTSAYSFTVLLDNISDRRFTVNSWETSVIEMYMTGIIDGAKFSSWQYYNWNTEEWVTIPYVYADLSYGIGADGSVHNIYASSSEYLFSLAALYAYTEDENHIRTYTMPYAISTASAANLFSASNQDAMRPLLIRPDMYKYFDVTLEKYAFSTSYVNGLTDVDEVKLEYVAGAPEIKSIITNFAASDVRYADKRNHTNDDNTTGYYEYGSLLDLRYNGDDSGYEIYSEDGSRRFRFIGWHLQIGDTIYFLQGSDSISSKAFQYQLICAENDEVNVIEFTLKAYFVVQYKQKFDSYDISGSASSIEAKSGKAAPQAYIIAADTGTAITIKSVKMSNNAVIYNGIAPTTQDLTRYYQINETSEVDGRCPNPTGYTGGSTFTTVGSPTWSFEYYFDAGLSYELHVNKNIDLYSTANIKDTSKARTDPRYNYYNSEFDTLYQLREDSVLTQDFSSFYNTGNGTYYDKINANQVTPSYLKGRALNCEEVYRILNEKPTDWASAYTTYYIYINGAYIANTSPRWETGTVYCAKQDSGLSGWSGGVKVYSSTTPHNVDIQYVSTATLVFYNMMYGSGIAIVNAELRRALTGGSSAPLTVWDSDTLYGDWVDQGNSPTFLQTAYGDNGEVVIRVTLMGGKDYADFVKYALKGMAPGNGITGKTKVYDMSGGSLFKSGELGYGRWIEHDMNKYYKSSPIISNTRVFGYAGYLSNEQADGNSAPRPSADSTHPIIKVGEHAATSNYYNTSTCGNGTQSNPYKVFIRLTGTAQTLITDNKQLSFISSFWEQNNFSCKDCYFKIETSGGAGIGGIGTRGVINLQGISAVYGASSAPQRNTAIWQPLCSNTSADGDVIKGFDGIIDFSDCTVFGLAVEEYASYNGAYYGLFAKINGGTVRNLNFRNGYFEKSQTSVMYLGLVCGYAIRATFDTIKFELNNDENPYYESEVITYSSSVSSHKANIFLYGPAYIGSLLGYGQNCVCNNITFNSSGGEKYAEIAAAEYGGVLIGAIEGGLVSDVTISGSPWLVSNAGSFVQSDCAGSLIGYAGGRFSILNNGITVDTQAASDNEELYVEKITMTGSPSIIVGTTSSYASGGLIGVVGPYAVIRGIKLTTSTSFTAFIVEESDHTATKNSIILRAVPKSLSSSAMRSINTYGFVGGIAGLNYGTIDGSNISGFGVSTINSYVYTYSGTAGGLVGGNFGTLTNFTLGTSFRLYAWEPSETLYSFNYGGLVGYNYGGTNANTLYVQNGASGTLSKVTYSGLINECKLTGSSSGTEGTTGQTGWNTASVYAFTRDDTYDSKFGGADKFITTGTAVQTASESNYSLVSDINNYEDSQNYLCMGGICGYSSGRIFNSVTNNVRVSTFKWRYACNESPSLGGYGFAVYAALICGYFDTPTETMTGWTSYLDLGTSEFTPSLIAGLNSSRIQSCVVSGGSININGNIWMDNKWNSSGPYEGGMDDYSLASGISVAGIVAGTSSKANSPFAVNTCKVTGTHFYVYFQAYGSTTTGSSATSKDIGWKVWTTEWSEWYGRKHINYHTACLRPFAILEVNAASIASGLVTPTTSAGDAGMASYCYSNLTTENKHYTTGSNVQNTYQDLGESDEWLFGWGHDDAAGADKIWMRYVRYEGLAKGKFKRQISSNIGSDTMDISMYGGENVATSGYDCGFYNGNVIKTDPNTGCLYCATNSSSYGYRVESGNVVRWCISDTAPSTAPAVITP